MKIKKLKYFVISAFIACLALFVGGLSFLTLEAHAQLSDIKLKDNYSIGELFTVPSASISYDGQTYTAVSNVICPNGDVLSSPSFYLAQVGNYNIEYRAFAGDKLLIEKKNFVVESNLASLYKDDSSFFYGANSQYALDKKGIVLQIADGDTFTYNKLIDMNDKSENDDILSFFLTPHMLGEEDAKECVIRFTDVYNRDNFLQIAFNSSNSTTYTYVVAGGNGQDMKGLEFAPNDRQGSAEKLLEYNGKKYRLFNNQKSLYGSLVNFSWKSSYLKEDIGKHKITLSYDSADKKVYVNKTLVIDLDEELFFDNGWSGFESGKTIMSISPHGLSNKSLDMVITDICGDDLSLTNIPKQAKPIIEIDEVKNDILIPEGITGMPYKIFDSRVYEPINYTLGLTKANVAVYKNYYSSTKSSVSISDYTFTPRTEGVYTIEYSIIDLFGEKIVTTVDVKVISSDWDSFTISIDEKSGDCNAFEPYKLPSYNINSTNQITDISIFARSSTGKTYTIDKDTLTFTPLEVGKYSVIYSCSDYIQSKQAKFILNVAVGEDTVLFNQPIVKDYYIKNCAYSFDKLQCNYIDENSSSKVGYAKLYYIDDDKGDKKEVTNDFVVTANEKLSLIYEFENRGRVYTKIVDVKVVDTGYNNIGKLNTGKYFQSNQDISFVKDEGVYHINSFSSNNDATMTFINELTAWDFLLEFRVDKNNCHYDKVVVNLTDSTNGNNLSISFSPSGEKTTLVNINNSLSRNINVVWGEDTFSMTYMDHKKLLTINGDNNFVIDDNIIEGFSNKKILLSLDIKNLTAPSTIDIEKVNANSISASKYDLASPTVFFEGVEENYVYDINSTITIPKFYCGDTIDPNPLLKVVVKNPKGEIITSLEGVRLDGSQDNNKEYTFIANSYGIYSIGYVASDYHGESTGNKSINCRVVDSTLPSIVIDKALTKANVNDNIKIANITISDNISSPDECKKIVYLISPSGKISVFKDNINDLYFDGEERGNYKIFYYVYDGAGNLVIASYQVAVK